MNILYILMPFCTVVWSENITVSSLLCLPLFTFHLEHSVHVHCNKSAFNNYCIFTSQLCSPLANKNLESLTKESIWFVLFFFIILVYVRELSILLCKVRVVRFSLKFKWKKNKKQLDGITNDTFLTVH